MLETHYALDDARFEQQFEACTLKPELFSHEAHLRLAWIHIKKYGVEKAVEQVSTQLFKYVAQLGAEEKFNKTLTIAAVRAVNHFMNKSTEDNFYGFIQQFPRLRNNFRSIINAHYGHDIFKSELAKSEYLEPDLLPFC